MPIEWNPKIKGGFKDEDMIKLIKKISPENLVVCPYCRTVNVFSDGQISKTCTECGNAYFREVRK